LNNLQRKGKFEKNEEKHQNNEEKRQKKSSVWLGKRRQGVVRSRGVHILRLMCHCVSGGRIDWEGSRLFKNELASTDMCGAFYV